MTKPRGRPKRDKPPVIPPVDTPVEIIPPETKPPEDIEVMTLSEYTLNRISERKKRALDAYSELGIVSHACQAAGISRVTWYNWIADDSEFALAAKAAEDAAIDSLVAEAHRRGLAKSDLLLMFSIKAKRPEYRDRQQVDVAVGGEIRVKFVPASD